MLQTLWKYLFFLPATGKTRSKNNIKTSFLLFRNYPQSCSRGQWVPYLTFKGFVKTLWAFTRSIVSNIQLTIVKEQANQIQHILKKKKGIVIALSFWTLYLTSRKVITLLVFTIHTSNKLIERNQTHHMLY